MEEKKTERNNREDEWSIDISKESDQMWKKKLKEENPTKKKSYSIDAAKMK